jgi:hypothetical protein
MGQGRRRSTRLGRFDHSTRWLVPRDRLYAEIERLWKESRRSEWRSLEFCHFDCFPEKLDDP